MAPFIYWIFTNPFDINFYCTSIPRHFQVNYDSIIIFTLTRGIMMIDYHIHTKLCGHADGEMEEYVHSAIDKGLDEIGFSDHFPLFHVVATDLSMRMEELPLYINKVRKLQKEFKKDISIKLGIEVEYTPEIEDQTRKLLKNYSFDYISGSIHFLGKWIFDHPAQKDEWERRDVYEVYKKYFSNLGRMITSGLFDIVTHPDLVKKFGYRPERGLKEIYNEVAKLIKRYNVCLEVNTAGLRRPVKEIYPSEEFLKICFNSDIPIILGSDAHTPEDVARDFDSALSLIKKVGYKKIATFSDRKRTMVNL